MESDKAKQVRRNIKGSVSIYKLFLFLSIAFVIGLLLMFYNIGPNMYVNNLSLLITILTTFVLIFASFNSYKNDNPLLFVFAVWTLIFINLRVLTLEYTEYSLVFAGYGININGINKTQIIILLGSLSLCLGLHFRRHKQSESNLFVFKSDESIKMLAFYWISMLAYLCNTFNVPVLSGIASIVSPMLLNIHIVFICFMVFFVVFYDKIDIKTKQLFMLSIVFFLLVRLFDGSRAGLLAILKSLFFIFLVLNKKYIKIKYLMASVALIPIGLFFFSATTYMRQLNATSYSTNEKISIFVEAFYRVDNLFDKEVLAPVFDRLGFLDYATMPCSKRDEFKHFLNFRTECESIVDNALTPGFDIFDAPKVSNIQEIYLDSHKIIPKSKQSETDYSSSEFTIFGEYYVLFGPILVYPILYFIGFLFRKRWLRYDKKTDVSSLYKKVILLYILDVLLGSFGTDWVCYRIVCAIITLFFYEHFFKANKSLKSVSIQPLFRWSKI